MMLLLLEHLPVLRRAQFDPARLSATRESGGVARAKADPIDGKQKISIRPARKAPTLDAGHWEAFALTHVAKRVCDCSAPIDFPAPWKRELSSA
ncbi:MAG: hypothetical protein EOP62_02950 [Sphingomonadales bacterium]|nr:MAG: hypothetical protein EOP62_02950 [Sphingomonadales bacterium]